MIRGLGRDLYCSGDGMRLSPRPPRLWALLRRSLQSLRGLYYAGPPRSAGVRARARATSANPSLRCVRSGCEVFPSAALGLAWASASLAVSPPPRALLEGGLCRGRMRPIGRVRGGARCGAGCWPAPGGMLSLLGR